MNISKQGFLKVRVDGKILNLTYDMKLDRYKNHDIEILIDRLTIKDEKLIFSWSIINLTLLVLLSIILIFMWVGTNHQATKLNFNLLWSSPLHFILIYSILKKRWNKFTYWFLIFSLFMIFTTILFWFALIQEFNPFVKPIILQLALIYYYYFKKCKNHMNLNKTNG